ncbi:unnamed protein product [Cylicocyclus nassatus]|uniref:G-protein coupled receptors family 2 profile 2 domain-containing protein n=1 Tax=Cylicocyclus nassatus TaxID=53992 RepID=A0AA36HDS7_CYLNA|nr:unnamed protein product [Cylicocyclus nassatus]
MFCWMLVEGYQLYLSLIQVFDSNKTRILPYCLFSYGFPAVVVGVIFSWDGYEPDQKCFGAMPSSQADLALFVPDFIIILTNVIILVIALRVLLTVNSRDRSRKDRLFRWLKGFATLLCLLGVTHLFYFLWLLHLWDDVFEWMHVVFNSLQALAVVFDVFDLKETFSGSVCLLLVEVLFTLIDVQRWKLQTQTLLTMGTM